MLFSLPWFFIPESGVRTGVGVPGVAFQRPGDPLPGPRGGGILLRGLDLDTASLPREPAGGALLCNSTLWCGAEQRALGRNARL